MFTKFSLKILIIFQLACCMLFSTSLMAEDVWQSITLSNHGKKIQTLKAIGIKAVAECGGQSHGGYVVVWGHSGSEIFSIGTLVDDFKEILPNSELDEFRGPDLSRKATEKDIIEIELNQNEGCKRFSARLVLGTTLMFPDNIRGSSKEYFNTNVRPGKQELKKWRELLDALSQGIKMGKLVIGDGVFSKRIVVKFGGKGIEPLARDLMEFVAKK